MYVICYQNSVDFDGAAFCASCQENERHFAYAKSMYALFCLKPPALDYEYKALCEEAKAVSNCR